MTTPMQDEKSMVAFYGPVGEHQTSIVLPYPMFLAWDTGSMVKRLDVSPAPML